mmetsp:Transcript_25886/g.60936  ORF Transcript_25886/g.60936 Transcript_25886/m.60936 type:complete len:598 (-) Transcript_25886:118-1911(-)
MPLWAEETRIGPIRHAWSVATKGNENRNGNAKHSSQHKTQPDPAKDAARMAALKKLRHKLVKLCSEHGDRSKPPVLAFERWLGRSALQRQPGDDPIIPSDMCGEDRMLAVDEAFTRDLSRTLPSWDASVIVAKELRKEASKQIKSLEDSDNTEDLETLCEKIRDDGRAVKNATKSVTKTLKKQFENNGSHEDKNNDEEVTLREFLISLQKAASALNESAAKAQRAIRGNTNSDGDGNIVFNGNRREGIYDVMLCGPGGKPRRPYLTVSSLHLTKLLRLWMLHNNSTTDDDHENNKRMEIAKKDPIELMNSFPKDERISFQKSLYCCLARYEGLKGAGYQCAVPGVAFDAAAEMGLGTTIECFASPLNCRYERFCSAFPDIERRFGSIGSFFDDEAFDPWEGSFEANPPFVPETMIAMGEKLERLLSDERRGPLSFLVVIPNWGAGIEFVKNLESSTHVRASSCIKASDHAFCDGAQHTKPLFAESNGRKVNPDLRPSSWDTAVILLQNHPGVTKWNVDNEKLEESFCSALRASLKKVPSKFTTLEAWERRGVSSGGSKNRQQQHGKSGRKSNNYNQRFQLGDGNASLSRKRSRTTFL